MKTYLQFLNESSKKILFILTNPSKSENPSSKELVCKDELKMVEICDRKNQPIHILFQNNLFFDKVGDKIKIVNSRYEEPKEILVKPENMRVLIRSNLNTNGLQFYDFLIDNDVKPINSKETIDICGDKYKTEKLLRDNNVSTTNSIVVSDEKSVKYVMDKFQNKFPVIVKTVRGSLGKGVMKVSKPDELMSILQGIWSLESDVSVLVQKYYEIDGDIRTFVIDGKIVGAMKRNKLDGDFRSNISLGSTAEPYELSDEEKEMVLQAHYAVGAKYSGIDHINTNKGNIVIEVNSCPGTTGIDKTLGKNITKQLIQYTLGE